ncbi:TIGR03987 family protein [Clostridium sp. 19966]|uniref:HsmA family protein n=1 Tax=Clostridium sp. 19966 TaxID=2768166 RepID=UPI0028DDC0F8|nr:HsmA family protein [Clostridium sp. 19966]MDT8717545.1 TIGR03987 family protein [Clostridium sp. 19966]
MLIYAIISITLALVFYTIGVWSEKNQGELKKWHLVMFFIGLIFDATGTTLMSKLNSSGFQFNFHGITGLAAILLMIFHALWATFVLIKNNKKSKENFHKFSIFVWLIWLIPYISGMIAGMSK